MSSSGGVYYNDCSYYGDCWYESWYAIAGFIVVSLLVTFGPICCCCIFCGWCCFRHRQKQSQQVLINQPQQQPNAVPTVGGMTPNQPYPYPGPGQGYPYPGHGFTGGYGQPQNTDGSYLPAPYNQQQQFMNQQRYEAETRKPQNHLAQSNYDTYQPPLDYSNSSRFNVNKPPTVQKAMSFNNHAGPQSPTVHKAMSFNNHGSPRSPAPATPIRPVLNKQPLY